MPLSVFRNWRVPLPLTALIIVGVTAGIAFIAWEYLSELPLKYLLIGYGGGMLFYFLVLPVAIVYFRMRCPACRKAWAVTKQRIEGRRVKVCMRCGHRK